ncbi:hypothetical protein SAMN04488508_101590 [Aquimarina spongiae]|uniref:Uncharacterized protein n=1 Tax=Aquimarina spongiae TaxID=570521 RepID=A0A1M6B244_9FLAO|nr:hypothetical protein SAMN04488508_101590 [Aquimarina spongiae]
MGYFGANQKLTYDQYDEILYQDDEYPVLLYNRIMSHELHKN